MIKLVFTFFGLLSFFASSGQDYLVTLKSDTLRGKVKVLSYDLVDKVQINEGKKKTTLLAPQVRRVFMNDKTYAPVKYDNSIRLMEVVVSGYLSLYAYKGQTQASYDTRVIQKIGGLAIDVPNINFKKVMDNLVEECPAVLDKVRNGALGRNDVEHIVNEYNTCIATASKQKMQEAVVATPTDSPLKVQIQKLKTKVYQSDMANKADVNDLLNSIADKVNSNEKVPAFMVESLKNYLSSRDDMKTETDSLIQLLSDQK